MESASINFPVDGNIINLFWKLIHADSTIFAIVDEPIAVTDYLRFPLLKLIVIICMW